MDKEKELPKRKHPRLKSYDYSSAGAYFVTICTQNKRCVLSRIVGRGLAPAEVGTENANCRDCAHTVGQWLVSAEVGAEKANCRDCAHTVGRGLAPAESFSNETVCVQCSPYGEIAEQQLFHLEERFPHLTIDQYVIMPNHIHVIFVLNGEAAGASPRPTIMDVVCAYKSFVARSCKRIGFHGKIFQTSFHEHVIRGREDYEEIAKYICENPTRWLCDELYIEE